MQNEQLIAGIFAFGLRHSIISLGQVIQWADRQIERQDPPRRWILDLSMSATMHISDVIRLLNAAAGNEDRVLICRGIYSLLPDLRRYGYEELASIAQQLYQLTYTCLEGNWSIPLLEDADIASDNFDWVREGQGGRIGDRIVPMTRQEVISSFHKFIDSQRDQQLKQQLEPVTYILAPVVSDR